MVIQYLNELFDRFNNRNSIIKILFIYLGIFREYTGFLNLKT
jgi:hypothetical protein